MPERIFTLSEAVSLIPRLRAILNDLCDDWNLIKALNPQIKKARDKAQFDGGSPYGVEYIETMTRVMSKLQQVRDLGVILKDVDKGLCDFPHMKGGRVVYLCWMLGEETIGFWHDIESGFGGREPLDPSDHD